MYFEVEITRADGSTVIVETKGIFSTSILTDTYWGDIKGQKLQILYDETEYEERVVVVKRMGD